MTYLSGGYIFQPKSTNYCKHKHNCLSLGLFCLSLSLFWPLTLKLTGLSFLSSRMPVFRCEQVCVAGIDRRKSRCVVKCFLGKFRFAGETLLRVVKSEENAPIPLINYRPGALTLPQSMPLFTHPPAVPLSSRSVSLYFLCSCLARSDLSCNTHQSGEQSYTCAVFGTI